MALELSGRRALVTGATGGIGEAIARALHGRGATVLVSGRRGERLERLRDSLGERVETLTADLADDADLDALPGRAGDVDVLVANAALPASGRLDEYSADQIDRALGVNLRAPIRLAHALLPAMLEHRFGRLVFISSMSGKIATAHSSLYSATKFGLRGFAFALHQELRDTGVGVTTVFPGFIRDAGMFAEAGVDLPRYVGTNTPDDVARGVLDGIERNRAEVDVAPLGMRIGARIAALAPEPIASVSNRLGSDKIGAALAEGQREKR